jgi:hypothetical protein
LLSFRIFSTASLPRMFTECVVGIECPHFQTNSPARARRGRMTAAAIAVEAIDAPMRERRVIIVSSNLCFFCADLQGRAAGKSAIDAARARP